MDFGCGVDIIEVERIQEAIESLGHKFLHKIYTENEIEYCNTKNKMRYQHFAARFAAKEAIFKAISSRLKDKYEITWTDVEIENDEMGRPKVHFLNDLLGDRFKFIDISLSHVEEYAVANCVVVFGD